MIVMGYMENQGGITYIMGINNGLKIRVPRKWSKTKWGMTGTEETAIAWRNGFEKSSWGRIWCHSLLAKLVNMTITTIVYDRRKFRS